jgi:hypothetical protein
MKARHLVAAGACVLGGAGVDGHATADPATRPPTIEITVIHATRTDGGTAIDPGLKDLPQLTRDQPFVRYNIYKLVERKELPLDEGKPATYPIVNGRTLQITLVDVEGAKAKRFHVRAAIEEPGKQAFLKLLEVTTSEGEPFFVGGQSFQGGTLFLELVVRP